jgi:hypothetical protein
MKNFYRFLSFCLLLLATQAGFAQNAGTLSGIVQDETGAALSFATVGILQTADNKMVTGAVTDDAGKFEIKTPAAGKYLLRASVIGYTQLDTPPFEVSGPEFSKNFGKLSLKQDTKVLQEVTVQSMRPTITSHADKLVVSVEGTALAAGNTAYEVLAKSPGVFIDQDGNIQLNGKGGIRIMIDGKLSYLTGKELQNFLKGMSAENLKDIEIITNPSSKYDAEGTAGILNINLKKNTLTGVNGSVNIGGQYNGMSSYSTGANINYKKGKWSSFLNADISRRIFYRNATFTREFNTPETSVRFVMNGRQEDIRLAPSVRLGTDYDISSNHSIGISANLYHQDFDSEFKTSTFQGNGNPALDSLITATNLINGKFSNSTFNAHYIGKIDTSGTTLTADVDYVRIINNANSRFINQYAQISDDAFPRLVLLSSDNPSNFNIFSAKTDFSKSFSKDTKLELGAKASHVISDNNLMFFTNTENLRIPDERRTSHFIYKENIYAAYVNFNTKLSEKWSVQSGLRTEQTVGKGNLLTTGTTFTRNYLNWFPSVFLLNKISKDYQIAYKYSRRINRPRYESMNPFVFYLDPYTYAQGNPNLRPAYTHSLELTQTLKSVYILTLGYAITKNFIAEIPEQFPESKLTIFQQTNVKQFKNINANLVLPVKIAKKWDINNNLTVAYQDYSVEQQGNILRNTQLFYYAQSTHTIQLPKKLMLELNGSYQGPVAYGLYKISSMWWVDAGLKRSFMEDKLELALNVTDIFKTRQVVGAANYNGNINEFDQYFGSRSFRLNLRYRFTKGASFEMKKRNTNLDELNRAGGNN